MGSGRLRKILEPKIDIVGNFLANFLKWSNASWSTDEVTFVTVTVSTLREFYKFPVEL